MLDLYDFYILGLPIETSIGECSFLKVREYPKFFQHLNALAVTKEAIVYKYYCEDNNKNNKETIDILQKLSLYEMITSSEEVLGMYIEIFEHVFKKENVFQYINQDNFEQYRKMILKMNVIKEDIVNPNPIIQQWIEKSRNYAANSEAEITFSDIVSSVAVGSAYSYEQVNDMTLYQLYTSFHRVGKFKSFDTTTLFATVAEKVNIEHWCGHVDLCVKEKHGLTQQEYNKKKKDIGLG